MYLEYVIILSSQNHLEFYLYHIAAVHEIQHTLYQMLEEDIENELVLYDKPFKPSLKKHAIITYWWFY